MSFITRFCYFWWDFIVGDSVTLAVGSAAALAATWLIARSVAPDSAQVVLPLAILVTLVLALRKP